MRPAAAATALAVTVLVACTPGGGGPASEGTASPTPGTATASAVAGAPVEATSPTAAPAVETLAWGPAVSAWDAALADARALPLEVVAGQVVVGHLSSPDPAAAAAQVRDLHLGGVILMGGSVTDAAGVARLTDAVAGADGRDWPVWISTDEEGGNVSRLAGVIPRLPSFMAAGAATDKGAVREAYASSAAEMRALGISVDYAPVADVTIGRTDPVIRTRSAGSDPDNVAATTIAAVDGFVGAGVVPVLKHFPGHGSVTVDSHVGLPRQERAVAALETRDLVPFARAIDAGAPAVMLGHIVVPEWGDEPATLSRGAYAYLREDLGFTGVAVTDALNMAAIADRLSSGEAAVAALAAGADVVLLPRSAEDAVAGIVAAVENGGLTRDRLDEAAARSILMMRWSDGLETRDPAPGHGRVLAAAGATLATADCTRPLVTDAARVTGGTERQRSIVEAVLASHGVAVDAAGPEVRLVPSGRTRADADVVVSLGGPWGLFDSTADAHLAVYGDSWSTLAGLADVLVGAAAAGGDWPVDMGPDARAACAAAS